MQSTQEIRTEVKKRADARIADVLWRLHEIRENKSRPPPKHKNPCEKHEQEREAYAKAAIFRHKAKRAHKNLQSLETAVELKCAQEKLLRTQKLYRLSVVMCGCSKKYNPKEK